MSNRTTLNKFELFVGKVRKIAKKRSMCETEEQRIKEKAMIVAALSSNHSWKTYKYLHNGEFDIQAINGEIAQAFDGGWKDITEADIEEIVNYSIDDHLFHMWAFHIPDKQVRQKIKNLFFELRDEFVDGIEPIERKEY